MAAAADQRPIKFLIRASYGVRKYESMQDDEGEIVGADALPEEVKERMIALFSNRDYWLRVINEDFYRVVGLDADTIRVRFQEGGKIAVQVRLIHAPPHPVTQDDYAEYMETYLHGPREDEEEDNEEEEEEDSECIDDALEIYEDDVSQTDFHLIMPLTDPLCFRPANDDRCIGVADPALDGSYYALDSFDFETRRLKRDAALVGGARKRATRRAVRRTRRGARK